MWPDSPEDTLRHYRAALSDPPLSVDAASLLELWTFDVLRFQCRRPDLMDEHPELPMRIRGAFGRRLAELDNPVDWRGRPGPRAYDVLFEPLARLGPGREIPRPFVIHAWFEADALIVELNLFGFANVCLDDAARAMSAALQGGIALRGDRSQRIAIEIDDILVRSFVPDPPPVTGSATLTFRSPVVVRHGSHLVENTRSILRSVPRRVAALAPFQSCKLVLESDLSERIDSLTVIDREIIPYAWVRHSRRQGDTVIPMNGYLGRLSVSGDFGSLSQLLRIAETCNIGSHASLGTGWFDLALYPKVR